LKIGISIKNVINNPKKVLRERILTLLRNQKEEERLIKSLAIKDKLIRKPEFKNAQIILFYASYDGEVDTFEMMKTAQSLGKTVCLPGINKAENKIEPRSVASLATDLEAGPYGIKEPNADKTVKVGAESIDLVVVPGVAFDMNSNRLGRGGGYYDRFLNGLPAKTPKIGLAFDFQMVDSLSAQEEHDVPVSCVLTN